jgi:hypothetical protein
MAQGRNGSKELGMIYQEFSRGEWKVLGAREREGFDAVALEW